MIAPIHKTLRDLVVGDIVIRNMVGIKQNHRITEITEDRIICGPWEFCRDTGVEIDELMSMVVSTIKPEWL